MDFRETQLESLWTQAGGERIHARVATAAPSTAPVVVLVHGLCVSSRYMAPLADALSKKARAYAPDLPGFGLSSKPDDVLDIPGLAHALRSWMDASRLESATIVANSLGCQVAVEVAVDEPHRVDGLVLVGPTFDPSARDAVVPALRWLRDVRFEPISLLGVILRDFVDCGPRRVVATYRHGLRDRIETKLPAVTAPALVVRGEHDPIAPQRWVEEAARLLPRGQVAVVRGAGHAVNYNAPQALAALVDEFLAETTIAPA